MSTSTDSFFTGLAESLCGRSTRATVSQAGPHNPALRAFLHRALGTPPGQPGSFLAPPVFESLFNWETQKKEFQSLDYVSSGLVQAMDSPPAHLAEERFPATRKPYAHQVRAWEILMLGENGQKRSAIVSTGTASGKTECFLVPILSDLYRQAESLHEGESLTGVQAVFLYPLNALINSQKDRLEAWTTGAKGKVRFCLYNGATPRGGASHLHSAGYTEVKTRSELYKNPPPVLVTNATMLEYMLVRKSDRPILDASRGKLKWIVLDEAHTYVGSNAAEISLLLRRVMHAFGVRSEDVQFVATSATIGDPAATDQLRQYLADLAGVGLEQVTLVTGKRVSPPLAAGTGPDAPPELAKLEGLDAASRYRVLADSSQMRALRESLGTAPLALPDVARRLGTDEHSTVRLLDFASSARAKADEGGNYFMPLRAHYFHRVQEGLWVCSNAKCSGRPTDLQGQEWGFGSVFFDHREKCEHCEAQVYELAICRNCGQEHLVADLRDETLLAIPVEGSFDNDGDDPAPTDDGEEQGDVSGGALQLMCGTHAVQDAQDPDSFDPFTGGYPGGRDGTTLRLARAEGGVQCSRCGIRVGGSARALRPLRLGGDFYLATAVPTLLESLPPIEQLRGLKPASGRQLLTFTDSRQGSASFAARTQFEAERGFLRASVYQRLWEQTQHQAEDPAARTLRESIAVMEAFGLHDAAEKLKEQLAKATGAKAAEGELPWSEMVRFLSAQSDVSHIRQQLKERYIAFERSGEQLAEILLLREFFRRPKKQNSLETLGLVRVSYRGIDGFEPPPEWLENGHTRAAWQELLEALMTYQVRASACVMLDHGELRLMGVPAYPRYLTPSEQPVITGQTVRWPYLKGRKGSQLAKALAVGLRINPDDDNGVALVNALLNAAWQQISRLLRDMQQGLQLDLKDRVLLRTVSDAYVCPITSRVLTSTLLGVTPFVEDVSRHRALYECRKVSFPKPPAVRLRGPFDCTPKELAVTETWLEADAQVRELRNLGVWFEFSDRIARGPAYFGAAEHSAQQSNRRLRQLEERFKDKDLNILSCSTTMEMGVNIGSLSAVTMNNVPPGPANFLQRAGRAGRSGQPRAVTLTMCRARPHELAVYRDPLWPFNAPIRTPRVALNSERIVRRHVNSLLFSAFVNQMAAEGHKLSSEWLFSGDDSRADRYVEWLETTAPQDGELLIGVRTLLTGSPLGHIPPEELLPQSGSELRSRGQRWRSEETVLETQLRALGEDRDDSTVVAARRSLEIQLKRHREEFLLANLANSSFLPSYGFPLNVVPLVTLTSEERQMKRKERDARKAAGDAPERAYNDFPTRQLAVALREYAPGAGIVLDGLVYQSEGVTLNWQIPTTGEDVKGIADLRYHYRCGKCGAVKSTRSEAKHCQACGNEVQARKYLRPNGFAVDLFSTPSTNLSLAKGSVGVETRISANTDDWKAFPAPKLGRFRFSHDGHIVFRNRGPARCGFALCLRCGRVAAEHGWAASAGKSPLLGHRPLRGAKVGQCTGYAGTFSEQRNVELGASITTDVLEFEFQDPATGQQLNDQSLAVTLSVALQLAAAELLEVEPSEIGRAINDYQGQDGSRYRSIILYDTADGGAGYVSSLPGEFKELFLHARRLLECTANQDGGCDSSCHNCLLSYSTQDVEPLLDRQRALAFLGEKTLRGFSLSPQSAVFGESTRAEYDSLKVLTARYGDGKAARRVRVHLSAPAERWDFASWVGWQQLRALAGPNCSVELVAPKAVLDELEWDQRNLIAAYLEGSGVELRAVPGPGKVGTLNLHLEFELASQSYRVAGATALAPDETWHLAPDGSVSQLCAGPLPSLGGEVTRLEPVEQVARGTFKELKFGKGLEGNLRGFGHRFFGALVTAEPRLKTVLENSGPLSAYKYEDKYISSPLVVALLAEVLNQVNASSEHTVGAIITTGAHPRQRPMRCGDDFEGPAQQKQAIEKVTGVAPRVIDGRQAKHRRELLLEWENGTKLTVRLDHGLGFMKLHRPEGMSFDGIGEDVMNRFLEKRHRLVLRDLGLAYVSLEMA